MLAPHLTWPDLEPVVSDVVFDPSRRYRYWLRRIGIPIVRSSILSCSILARRIPPMMTPLWLDVAAMRSIGALARLL